ncbi:uncharacterized protein DFL_001567 [Arthrobotrys flagrans]|uniref:F-box domain-containing protein n=1 Tax=Arthrobotrys flagrans TaxID=97331 RepID=A0A437A896_ARTFL|nr:hypothetical protein DFL_001567 [Arthrobotrys flagrans]
METLPNELLDRIAFFLSLEDLKRFSLACHRIKNVSVRYIFRRIKLTYGLSDEELREPEACYSCYVQRAKHVREIHLLTESKSFYHYNLQGCHSSIIRDSLMPFNQLESLGFFEHSETSWHDCFSIIKKQLETKPKLRYLSLQPNLGERGRGPKTQPKDENVPWLQEPLSKLQTLRLSFFTRGNNVSEFELERVGQFIEIVGKLKQATESLQTLILDGSLNMVNGRTPLMTCKPLSFPRLELLHIRDLRFCSAMISNIVGVETLRNVRILSGPRPDNWRTDTEILDRFLPFSNLKELSLSHAHDYYHCGLCRDEHRIFHVGIAPAFEDSKILSKHLRHLEVVKWYSAYAPPLLFRYKITRNNDGGANLTLKRSHFKRVDPEVGCACSDYHGIHPDLEILPCDDDGVNIPPRINWRDLAWFEPKGSESN